MPEADPIAVTFVDAADGTEIGRAQLPPAQLPESFATATTLELGGASWSVERAEPPHATQFRATGALRLTLRRVELMDPQELLYSLPTICDTLPPLDGNAVKAVELLEDDWRQVELVHTSLTEVVAAQLDAVRAVYEDEAEGLGFRNIHVRTEPAAPLPGAVSLERLLRLVGGTPLGRIGFVTSPGAVADSFCVGLQSFILYGRAEADRVHVIGVQRTEGDGPEPEEHLAPVLRAFDLVLVDWCRGTILG
jgi:hypothetical protein